MSTYIHYYKQLHRTATVCMCMGSPVSIVVAENIIVMQKIEEQALAAYKWTLPL